MRILRRWMAAALVGAFLANAPAALAAPAQFPSQQRYIQAMHHADHYLVDPKLRGRVTLETGADGAPKYWSGSFGTVFRGTTTSGRQLSIRVFHPNGKGESVGVLQRRYETMQTYFDQLRGKKMLPPEIIEAAFVPHGLAIDGEQLPLLKMPWVGGRQLDDWVGRRLGQGRANAVDLLAHDWKNAMADLGTLKIAHGDLHHGNVKIDDRGHLRLLDYDGMYVPGLAGLTGWEIGHPNYQHPAYHFDAGGNFHAANVGDRPFDDKMDNFSSIVIYVSLKAVAKQPELWQKYHNEDNLIFEGKRDFLHPDTSPVFADLKRSPDPEVRMLASKLAAYAKGSPKAVPSLKQALDTASSPGGDWLKFGAKNAAPAPAAAAAPRGKTASDWLNAGHPKNAPANPSPAAHPDPDWWKTGGGGGGANDWWKAKSP